ncbi:hypothetical protein AC578_8618 [Pseudocercospora eumusae]|uniref:Uncharacterized protein n=1 Tax=Pseudocercospora eumusae TaxID=321146 RepID=A0A139HVX1_9PEZI|nr:hypothetical protein AC578_8618 [Pseudocercospora eumusae]
MEPTSTETHVLWKAEKALYPAGLRRGIPTFNEHDTVIDSECMLSLMIFSEINLDEDDPARFVSLCILADSL